MTDYINTLIKDDGPALVYIMDPMCSWCWAFKPVIEEIRAAFPEFNVYTLPGGLAPDSSEPMPEAQKVQISSIWKKIESTVGTTFNHDFWTQCEPRRSTYPTCRALLLARDIGKENEMIESIQRAYYLNAQNPSDMATLALCAAEIGMDIEPFKQAMVSDELDQRLQQELTFHQRLGVQGFPSLVLKVADRWMGIGLDYKDAKPMIEQIKAGIEKTDI